MNKQENKTNKNNKVIKIVYVFLFVLVIISLIVSFLMLWAGGLFTKKPYLKVWSKEYYTQFSDDRLKLVSHGVLAPSVLNLQPWHVQLDKNNETDFFVYANTNNISEVLDPKGRNAIMSIGSFLEYVSISAKQIGLSATITLFPQGELQENSLMESLKKTPIAKVRVEKSDKLNSDLYNNMFRSNINRNDYLESKISKIESDNLTNLNTYKNVKFKLIRNLTELNPLVSTLQEVIKSEDKQQDIVKEKENIFRVNNYEKSKDKFGLSLDEKERSNLIMSYKQGFYTLVPKMNNSVSNNSNYNYLTKSNIENIQNVGIITSKANTRLEQLEAGMLFAKVLLNANKQGYSAQILNQTQDVVVLKEYYEKIHALYAENNYHIQIIFKLGIPNKDNGNNMRYEVKDILVK